MKADHVERLKEFERETQRLKRIVANQALDIDGLKESARGLREARPQQAQQPAKRRGNLKHGSDPRTGRATASVITAPRPDGLDRPPVRGRRHFSLLNRPNRRRRHPRRQSSPAAHRPESPATRAVRVVGI